MQNEVVFKPDVGSQKFSLDQLVDGLGSLEVILAVDLIKRGGSWSKHFLSHCDHIFHILFNY